MWKAYLSYFKNQPARDAPIYLIIIICFMGYLGISALAEFHWSDKSWGCTLPPDLREFENVMYPSDPCLDIRYTSLGGMNRREAAQLIRIVVSVFCGAMIGYERRSPDRPAGIRTMSIVALGSCTFTLAGTWAFRTGSMGWDAARVSASVPAGCGFLGAGLIYKGMVKQKEGPDMQEVHGLTTAASVWISAAIGVAAGGGMFTVSLYATLTIVLMLRFGPRNKPLQEEEEEWIKQKAMEEQAAANALSNQDLPSDAPQAGLFSPLSGKENLDSPLIGANRKPDDVASQASGLARIHPIFRRPRVAETDHRKPSLMTAS